MYKRGRSTKTKTITFTFLLDLERNSDINNNFCTADDRDGDLPLHRAFVAVAGGVLPIHLLSNRYGKKNEVLESTGYIGAIFHFQLLL